METLLPVMFHRYLNDDVWKALAELSHFYRQLCAKEINRWWRSWRKRYWCLYVNWKRYSLWDSSIQCNIYLYIFHMKLS
jgi:hypothetical protein